MSDAILARFDSRCSLCDGGRIVASRDAIVEIDGEWVHEQCAADEGLLDEDED